MSIKPVKKRISYYQLQAEIKDSKTKMHLSKEEIKNELLIIYKRLKVNSNDYKYSQFQAGFTEYIIEFIRVNDLMIFARIGKQTNEKSIISDHGAGYGHSRCRLHHL